LHYIYIYIYIYIYTRMYIYYIYTHTHTHTHIDTWCCRSSIGDEDNASFSRLHISSDLPPPPPPNPSPHSNQPEKIWEPRKFYRFSKFKRRKGHLKRRKEVARCLL